MRIVKLSVLCVALFASMLLSAADPARIAVVNVEKIFNEYYKTKIVESQLEEQRNVYRTHLAAMNRDYQAGQQAYKELLDAAQNITLKESERQAKSKLAAEKLVEVRRLETEINQYLTEKARQFQQMEDAKRSEITTEILAEVQRRAAIDNFDLVIDYSGKTSSSLGSVIYFKPNLDITSKVLEELNRGNREAQQKNTEQKP